ncbi:calcium-binding protein [Streptomyces sp. ND05-3B]|nr:calcium-binding protein [Streptomyces caniscabiei]UJV42618.1 calcium-binding protein [Streptomyces sp. AMCC400023]MBE4756988.1 calcium-binding protein [Streptomyces caniscabiei]MBE4770358.1 calcium-binding protein [Streptomyces caniscabiei]MBE4785502.1 calcium-binding protein [Streptomyces caniscabiei]
MGNTLHKRAIVGAVTGALALTAFVAPAAQAAPTAGDTKISNVVVNGGKPVVVGVGKKTFSVSFNASDNSGISLKDVTVVLYHGASLDTADSGAVANGNDESLATCKKVNATTASCKASFTVETQANLINSVAGTWKVWALAAAKDFDYVEKDPAKTFKIQRQTKLAGANASPEPVKKGATITVTSSLTRANWDTEKFPAYGGQAAKLQFKKAGTSAYKDVKTVKSSSTGALKTTVKATADGSYRYVFAGSSGTAAVTSAGDAIDVK